jgi:Ribbon-helix-helix protein, copG family
LSYNNSYRHLDVIHTNFSKAIMAKKKQRGGKRPGAGRPVNPEGRSVTVTVSVPEALVNGLKSMAKAEGWSKSKAVSEAIRSLLKRKKIA